MILPKKSSVLSGLGCFYRILVFKLALTGAFLLFAPSSQAHPRMVSFDYPDCRYCHVAVQGRGLLTGMGRSVDMEQSLSPTDATGWLLGALIDPKYNEARWKGRFGNVLADFTTTTRFKEPLSSAPSDRTFAGIYRQIVFLGSESRLRINTELAFLDSGLKDLALGPDIASLGGDSFFLKKLTLDYRFKHEGGQGGSELSIGRDYLPIGLQLDDVTSYFLALNRNGIYDYPTQLKYFTWRKQWLASAFLFAPSFDENIQAAQEYGTGFMFEYYPRDSLVVGMQSLLGWSDLADRSRSGLFLRWGINEKWALLAESDLTTYWGRESASGGGSLNTSFLQVFYNHQEWLVSSIAGNYAHGDELRGGGHPFSARYTLTARISRNLTLGFSMVTGNSQRNLSSGNEAAAFAAIKF